MKASPSIHKRRTKGMIAALALTFAAAGVLVWSPFTGSLAQQPEGRQLLQAVSVKEWPSKAKRWALVIGVDQYRDGNISALRGAANDAATLARALTQYAGFPADQVILLATDQPEERQPTRINILTYLSNIAGAVPKDGLLLVSFAGHGLERGGQAYLIPSDARLTDDISLLEESAVSVQRMHNRIRSTGVGQVVVLLDACRNDPGGRADAPNNLTAAYTSGFNFDVRNREVQAYATIYATAVGQRAFEYVEKKQGYFSWAVVEGLKGAAANERGEVTLAALVKYVQDTVPKRVAIDLGASKQQRPFADIDGYMAADLVIAVGQPPNAAANNIPAGEPKFDPAAFELSYWESIKTSTDPEDFKAYLKKYPNGQFADLAGNYLRRLGAAEKTESKSATNTSPAPVNTGLPKALPKPGTVVKNQIGLELVYVPPGSFDMGSKNGSAYEKPAHRVTIDSGFFMGKYEVTQAQWQAVMGNNPSKFTGDESLPVEQVSWDDAQDFINKLNEMNDGYKYSLPTEAEWEYACRAGTKGDYYARDPDDIAWYGDKSEMKTHRVGSKQPNAFGLYDMSGNVWEWCRDWWVETYEGAPTDGSARLSGGAQKNRVLRGGSWGFDALHVRSAYRFADSAGNRYGLYGFRLVAEMRTQ